MMVARFCQHSVMLVGIEIKKRKKVGAIGGKAPTTTGFGASSQQNTQSKCAVCTKTVYPMEYVGAGDKVSFCCLLFLIVV
jgi:hypothetical protein